MTVFYPLILFYLIAMMVMYWVNPFPNSTLVTPVLYLASCIISLITGVQLLRLVGYLSSRARSILLLVIGVFSWFIGDAYWSLHQALGMAIQYPSIADYAYVFGYIVVFIGILIEIKHLHFSYSKLPKSILLAGIAGTTALVSLFLYLTVTYSYMPEAPLLENIITIGFGFGDMLLVVATAFLLTLIYELGSGKLATSWLFWASSFSSFFIADLLYAMFNQQYNSGGAISNLADSLYILGYLLLACGFYTFYIFTLRAQGRVSR